MWIFMIRSELQWRLPWRCWVIHHSSGEETQESSLSAGILTRHINKISTLSLSCLSFTYRSQELSPHLRPPCKLEHTHIYIYIYIYIQYVRCVYVNTQLFKYSRDIAFYKKSKKSQFHWNTVTHILLKSFKHHKKVTIINTEIQQYSKSQ